MMTWSLKVVLVGVGNVGQGFLTLMRTKGGLLRKRYGLQLLLVGAADTSGAALAPEGLGPGQLLELKAAGHGVAAYPEAGCPGMAAVEAVRQAGADMLLEASITNLEDGQPGLGCMEAALERGMHVVTANKGPLVLAYPDLAAKAQSRGVQLRFSATAGGALPTVNIGQRDLVACDIHRVEAALNGTTTHILGRMEEGATYDEALAEAQAAGIAEADPTLDVDGWDAANKLVIVANSVLGYPARLSDLEVEGIRGIAPQMIEAARAEGKRIRLIGTAEREGDGYRLAVRPIWLDADHPLGRMSAHEMGVVYYTDIMGRITATVAERGPLGTSAAMLRDVVGIWSRS